MKQEKMLDGKALGQEIQADIAKKIFQGKIKPSLAVLLIGNDPASRLYVDLKKKASQKVGINFHEYLLLEDTPQDKILEVIDFLNKDEETDAILVQLPLPQHLDTDLIIKSIDPKKDVDGFHPKNIENLLNGKSSFIPGLPLGIIKLLEATKEDLTAKKSLIISKSDVFFRPLNKLLADKGLETKVVKPDDPELKNLSLDADVLIVSCGKAFFINPDMVKKDAIVIDVGTNTLDKDHTVGDVDYTNVFPKAKFITPVPGGVGPMTVAMLLYNTLKLAEAK